MMLPLSGGGPAAAGNAVLAGNEGNSFA